LILFNGRNVAVPSLFDFKCFIQFEAVLSSPTTILLILAPAATSSAVENLLETFPKSEINPWTEPNLFFDSIIVLTATESPIFCLIPAFFALSFASSDWRLINFCLAWPNWAAFSESSFNNLFNSSAVFLNSSFFCVSFSINDFSWILILSFNSFNSTLKSFSSLSCWFNIFKELFFSGSRIFWICILIFLISELIEILCSLICNTFSSKVLSSASNRGFRIWLILLRNSCFLIFIWANSLFDALILFWRENNFLSNSPACSFIFFFSFLSASRSSESKWSDFSVLIISPSRFALNSRRRIIFSSAFSRFNSIFDTTPS